ncbi:MAG: VanZ family protein [Lachnospiraceae bacterium]|nr:VanZ family protein [Lachnospiraceae bacterium]
MKNRQEDDETYVVGWCLFVVYLMSLAYFLFFAEATGRTFTERTYHYNLIPLHEIRRFLVYRRQLGFSAVALNVVGNVLAFVPFGVFLPLLVRRVRSFGKTLLLGFEFSLLVEIVQLFSKVGSFDVDDIMLNTLGVLLGYALFRLMYIWHWHHKRKRVDS